MPDEPLKPFGSRTACPKCGCLGNFKSAWRAWEEIVDADGQRVPGYGHLYVGASENHDLLSGLPTGSRALKCEEIQRTCTCCGYAWDEAPLDAGNAAPPIPAVDMCQRCGRTAQAGEAIEHAPDCERRVTKAYSTQILHTPDGRGPLDKEPPLRRPTTPGAEKTVNGGRTAFAVMGRDGCVVPGYHILAGDVDTIHCDHCLAHAPNKPGWQQSMGHAPLCSKPFSKAMPEETKP